MIDIYETVGQKSKPEKHAKVKAMYTHDIAGQKERPCGCFGRNTPAGKGQAHVVRSHDEIKDAELRAPDLEEGVSLRFGMGDMEHSIDDGKNY